MHPDRMPQCGDAFREGRLGYHLRSGSHFLSRYDWDGFIRFIQAHRITHDSDGGQAMAYEKVYAMRFAQIYPLLVNKAVKKGRTPEEVDQVISWLTGYSVEQIAQAADSTVSYGDFFRQAPRIDPNSSKITGVVCGVRVESIEDPLMRQIRYLDKLVDELAKGRPMDKILRSSP